VSQKRNRTFIFSGLDDFLVQFVTERIRCLYLEGLSETGENIMWERSATQENKYPSDQTVKMLTETLSKNCL